MPYSNGATFRMSDGTLVVAQDYHPLTNSYVCYLHHPQDPDLNAANITEEFILSQIRQGDMRLLSPLAFPVGTRVVTVLPIKGARENPLADFPGDDALTATFAWAPQNHIHPPGSIATVLGDTEHGLVSIQIHADWRRTRVSPYALQTIDGARAAELVPHVGLPASIYHFTVADTTFTTPQWAVPPAGRHVYRQDLTPGRDVPFATYRSAPTSQEDDYDDDW